MFGLVPWHPIVRHDGPVSFRRAFRKEDWARLLAAADVSREVATVERWRPGRLCVGGGSEVGDAEANRWTRDVKHIDPVALVTSLRPII